MKTIVTTQTAQKQLQKLQNKDRRAIMQKIEVLRTRPEALQNNIKKLQGSSYYRLRVGNYRVIFDEDGTIITIIEVGHRREIYR